MKPFLLLLAVFALLTLPSLARLGETREQCLMRYGKPIGGDETQLVFEKEGLQIIISFYNGKADYLAFSNAYGMSAKPKPLTDEEITRLLEKNRGNEVWTAKPTSDGRKTWTAPTRYAEVNSAGEFVIMAQEYARRPERTKPTPGKDRLREF